MKKAHVQTTIVCDLCGERVEEPFHRQISFGDKLYLLDLCKVDDETIADLAVRIAASGARSVGFARRVERHRPPTLEPIGPARVDDRPPAERAAIRQWAIRKGLMAERGRTPQAAADAYDKAHARTNGHNGNGVKPGRDRAGARR